MRTEASVIAVVGHKKSGKTTVLESIAQVLTKAGYRVATAKHITETGFSMDTEGKDTWKHSKAGANPVVSVSDIETAVLIRNGEARFSLDQMFNFAPETDVILLEGFSRMVLGDERVGKVLCVRDMTEYEDFREKAKGKVIASCSTRLLEKPILRVKEDFEAIARNALEFVAEEGKVTKALESALNTKITINGADVPLQSPMLETIRSVLLSMISALENVSISGNEDVHIKIVRKH